MDYFDWYAAYLHRTCPVADAHRDLVTEVYRRRLRGERGVLNTYYKEEMQESGVNLVVASLFLGGEELKDCMEEGVFPKGALLKKSMEMLAAFLADLEEAKGRMQLVTDRETLLRTTAKRGFSRQYKVGIVLYLEGLDMLEGEPELLRCFYAMGVRGAALTWNRRQALPNVFAEGCGSADGGISENRKYKADKAEEKLQMPAEKGRQAITGKGAEVLLLMEKLGIFVDSSHLSREAALLLPSITKKPFAATHSNSTAVLPHRRNLTDEEIKEIADRGGVIGVNAYRKFVCPPCENHMDRTCPAGGEKTGYNGEKAGYDSKKSEYAREGAGRGFWSELDALCDHVIYLKEKAGEDHVGLGLDFGEDTVLAGYQDLPKLTAALLRRGFSVETVKKVLGGNWIRYLSEMLK